MRSTDCFEMSASDLLWRNTRFSKLDILAGGESLTDLESPEISNKVGLDVRGCNTF